MTAGWSTRIGLVASLCCCGASAAQAADTVVVTRNSSGVAVRYDLAAPATELQFRTGSSLRTDYWSSKQPGLQLAEDKVQAINGRKFSRASFQLVVDRREADRVYASLIAFDATSSIVNIDYLRLRGRTGGLHVTIHNAFNPVTRRCEGRVELDDDDLDVAGRYMLLSNSLGDCRARERARISGVFVAANTPRAVLEQVTDVVGKTHAHFARKLGIDLPPATIFLTWAALPAGMSFRGDVGWHSVIALRFRAGQGSAWMGDAVANLRMSVTHEIVHLWVGKFLEFPDTGGVGHDWLHEGAAEYLALLELTEQGALTRDQFIDRLERRLDSCMRQLGDRSLQTVRGPRRGGLIYDCGVLVQFVYDAAMRAQSSGMRTVADVWKSLLAQAPASGSHAAEPSRFLAANPEAERVLQSFLRGPRVDGNEFVESMGRLGVEMHSAPAARPAVIKMAWLLPLFRADCSAGPTGFKNLPDRLELDGGSSCRTIPQGYPLRYAEGVDVIEHSADAFRAVAGKCAERGSIALAGPTPADARLTLSCPGPITLPSEIRIGALPHFSFEALP